MSDDLARALNDLLPLVTPKPKKVTLRRAATAPGSIPGRRRSIDFSLEMLCRDYTEEGYRKLVELIEDEATPAPTRLEAIRLIFDRGWGKPSIKLESKSVTLNVHETLKELGRQMKEPPRLVEDVEAVDVEVQDGS